MAASLMRHSLMPPGAGAAIVWTRRPPAGDYGPRSARRALSDHGDVDDLLEQRAGERREEPGGGRDHRRAAEGHPGDDALAGDARATGAPVSTASATRSTRSTMMTASAASDDAVAPAAPIAMPTSAAASAGRVVDAVADHHHRPAGPAALRLHERELALGRLVRVDAVDADPPGHLRGRGRGRRR